MSVLNRLGMVDFREALDLVIKIAVYPSFPITRREQFLNGNLVPVLSKIQPLLNNDQCLKVPTRTKMRGRPLTSARKHI